MLDVNGGSNTGQNACSIVNDLLDDDQNDPIWNDEPGTCVRYCLHQNGDDLCLALSTISCSTTVTSEMP